MTLIIGLLIGGTLGFLACAALTLARDADNRTEYARGWQLGYHAGKQAREEQP